MKLEKYIEKCNQKKHNITFQPDQKGLFRTLEAVENRKGDADICRVLGRYLGAKRANAKYAIDGRGES